MKILTVTTYNNKLEGEYAHKFIETYNWPFDLKKFVDRNKDRQARSSYEEKSLDFITDGVRFCYKVYGYTESILQASLSYNGIICIDADSVFYKEIDGEWIDKHIHRND